MFLSPREGYAYTLLPYFLQKESILSNFLFYPFGNFDAVYYLLIAAKGYLFSTPPFILRAYFYFCLYQLFILRERKNGFGRELPGDY